MSQKPLNDLHDARVQKTAKWIAGHAIEVISRPDDKLEIRFMDVPNGGDSFITELAGFPSEGDVARIALAIGPSAGNYDIGYLDDETVQYFLLRPLSGAASWLTVCGTAS